VASAEPAPASGAERVASAEPATASGAEGVASAEPATTAPAPATTATAVVEAPTDEPTLDSVRSLWPAVLDALRADNGMLAACLGEAHPVELRGEEVVVAFAEHDTFNRRMADGREHRAAIDAALRDLAGSPLRVVFELRDPSELANGEPETQPPSEDELVARFKTEFDAEEIVPDDDPQSDDQEDQP
jgi:DNA polymerase III subunit gamma/tau